MTVHKCKFRVYRFGVGLLEMSNLNCHSMTKYENRSVFHHNELELTEKPRRNPGETKKA